MLDHQNLAAVQSAAQCAVDAAFGTGLVVTAIDHWGGGVHNSGYRLLLDNGKQIFMKVEKENIFPRTRRCQIEREVNGIRLAAQAGINVAEVVGCDTTGSIAGCRYLLEEFIDRSLLGEVLDTLGEDQRAPLLAEFGQVTERIYAIRGDAFGELYPGGWLGRYDSWREMMIALSRILLEDTAELGLYSSEEMILLRETHDIALDAILYEGPAILTHNDLHIWNVFVEPDHGELRVGKLFDFGLSLFQAGYLSCFGQYAFQGQEAAVALRFGVSERELHAFRLMNDLEFVNFASGFRFAPDKPYGWLARRQNYLADCKNYLAR